MRERARAQEALLVRVQDGHQGDLRQIQPFPQEIDADQDVEDPQAQIPEDLHALQGGDVRVEVAHLEA